MYIGKPIRRDEDYRFLRGRGTYTDDVAAPGAAHAAFVRSPHAHARILSVNKASVAAMPGVLCVLAADDWQGAGLGALPCISELPSSDGAPMRTVLRPVFAGEEVCHVGDTVAAVVAETHAQALDAAESLEVDYEPLPAVTDPHRALSSESPIVHTHLDTNLVQWTEHGDRAATDAAFERAHHVTRVAYYHTRASANPIEPRAYVGAYDPARDHFTLWAAGQNPHFLQRMLATQVLHVPSTKLRVIVPDVGGGFGVKFFLYSEQPVVLWTAKLLGRPVRWTAGRSESFLTDTHSRDHYTRAEMAFDEAGRILALRCETVSSYGAYNSTYAPIIQMMAHVSTLTGPYKIPAAYARVHGVFTNTTPVDAYRGVKQTPAYLHEKLIDQAARELGMDPAEIRLLNYLRPSDYPYLNAVGHEYDSGDPPRQHATLASLVDYAALRAERAEQRSRGIRLGLGFASVIESTGMGPSQVLAAGPGLPIGGWESGVVRVHPDGKVTLFVGTHSHGQSHETTFRQIAADRLGLPIEDVELTQGDTALGPGNLGTAAARALGTAGMALERGCARIIERGRRLAAHLMECAPEDVEYADGAFSIPGTDREIGFTGVAEMAYSGASYPAGDFELGLEETVFYDPIEWSYPTALHLAVVIVDEETGEVRIRDYYTVDDCGRVINPLVVHGQVHGGLAQGVGQALLERIAFDESSGQVLSGSFVDYAMPRADHLPFVQVAFQETLTPHNALGAKGCSETGVVGAPPALASAILDALSDLGVEHIEMPFTPERVWRAIGNARTRR